MTYGKYEFDTVPDLSEVDGSVVELGYLVETKGTYDDEGKVITEPVMSDKIAVDVLYHNEVIEDLEQFRVFPLEPKHFIGGQEELYYSTL